MNKVALFVYREDGYPYITWIKDNWLADKVEQYLRFQGVMYLERHDYEIGESDIKFDDDSYVNWKWSEYK